MVPGLSTTGTNSRGQRRRQARGRLVRRGTSRYRRFFQAADLEPAEEKPMVTGRVGPAAESALGVPRLRCLPVAPAVLAAAAVLAVPGCGDGDTVAPAEVPADISAPEEISALEDTAADRSNDISALADTAASADRQPTPAPAPADTSAGIAAPDTAAPAGAPGDTSSSVDAAVSAGSAADSSARRFTAIAAGDVHSCGIEHDGAAVCWGQNDYQQTEAPAGGFTAIAVGSGHSCAIRTDGAAVCWGTNKDFWGNYHGQAVVP